MHVFWLTDSKIRPPDVDGDGFRLFFYFYDPIRERKNNSRRRRIVVGVDNVSFDEPILRETYNFTFRVLFKSVRVSMNSADGKQSF